MLLTSPSGVACQIKICQKFSLEKFPHKCDFRSLWCSSSKIQKMLLTPPDGVECQKVFWWKFTHISIIAGLCDNQVPRIEKCSSLDQVVPGVKKIMPKIFSWKDTQWVVLQVSMMIQCRESKNAVYSTRWCRVSKKLMSKIFWWKFTHVSIIAGLCDNQVPRIKKCSSLHQVVSCVKKNIAQNFLVNI
jgi:hypothetical protein